MGPTDRYNTVPKVIDFPRYNMNCSGENVILRGIFHAVSRFPLHFIYYRGNLDYFLDSTVNILVHKNKASFNSVFDPPPHLSTCVYKIEKHKYLHWA